MTRDTSGFRNRVYMAELEEEIGRKRATIRGWEREGILPQNLMPLRDEIGWRYWTPAQVRGLKEFAKEQSCRQGCQPAAS